MKDINDYEKLYAITEYGEVWSYKRNKFLKKCLTKSGYYIVNLHKNGVMKSYRINRLVAIAFIPNPNNLPLVNHKDENKLNNSVDNLEWCDIKYNNNYGNRNKKLSESKKSYNLSVETRQKLSNSSKGRKLSDDTKRKISESKAKMSKEKKAEITEKIKTVIEKSVICIETNTIYKSIVEASLETNTNASNISSCCKGRFKTAGGYHWKYASEF